MYFLLLLPFLFSLSDPLFLSLDLRTLFFITFSLSLPLLFRLPSHPFFPLSYPIRASSLHSFSSISPLINPLLFYLLSLSLFQFPTSLFRSLFSPSFLLLSFYGS
uniref:Uncharacterized protein n=1 Tax=Cacopsylla melanoneura TaxID=428564 RepID=A0A8D9BLB5_9HEMI